MKSVLAAAALSVATALPGFAFDPAKMTEAEQQAFGNAIRDYLLANPQVLVDSINVLEQRRADQESQSDKLLVENNRDAIFQDGHSWVGGNPDGDLTLVEFVDYRCGYCRKVNPELEALIKDDGNIRFILKEFPILGPESEMASRFAISVQQLSGPDDYKRTHDALMGMRAPVTEESLTALAGDLGLDAAPIIARMASNEVTAVLQANRQLGETMSIQGTPSFVIGPELLRGIPQAGLAPAVDAIRSAQKG